VISTQLRNPAAAAGEAETTLSASPATAIAAIGRRMADRNRVVIIVWISFGILELVGFVAGRFGLTRLDASHWRYDGARPTRLALTCRRTSRCGEVKRPSLDPVLRTPYRVRCT
jgi:hypothetical protein